MEGEEGMTKATIGIYPCCHDCGNVWEQPMTAVLPFETVLTCPQCGAAHALHMDFDRISDMVSESNE